MVVGNDGYFDNPATRSANQLYLFKDPIRSGIPDAVIELPLGSPAEFFFDDDDNLIVQDHTWYRVWVINFEKDPSLLRPVRRGRGE